MRAAGGTAHYFSVNLTDADGVAAVINKVRERSGRIDVLLHAAGIERSHFLPDKDPREFDLVFDVKSDGWFNLLHAIGDMPLGATVAFSSVAGRFGNAGQADYSSANDLLCKITSSFRTTRPANSRHRHRLVGVGRNRHGDPRLHPEDDGTGRHRHAAARSGHSFDSPRTHCRRDPRRDRRRSASGRSANEWDATGGLDIQALAASLESAYRRKAR